MRWRVEFYNERRGILMRHAVEASSPAAAVSSGREAVLAAYPSPPATRRPSLFERAQRAGGRDDNGWVLYRIGIEGGAGSAGGPAARS